MARASSESDPGTARSTASGSRLPPGKKSWGWGGWRPGAGRKPKGDVAGVSHRTRAAVAARYPVLVILRIAKDLPGLRKLETHEVLRDCLREGNATEGFRVVHYAVLPAEIHLLVEAANRERLSRGMQGLCIRIARGLNRSWGRKGTVFADRYEDKVLRTPAEVRAALASVLVRSGEKGVRIQSGRPDPYTSAPWFDGWARPVPATSEGTERPVDAARTWLLREGWRRHGLLPFSQPRD